METSEVVDKYMGKLAATIGDMGPHAWEVMVQGQIVEGLDDLLWGLVWCAIAVVGGQFTRKSYLLIEEATDNRAIACLLAGLGSGFSAILGTCCLSSAVRHLGAPEYQAMLTLLEAAGGK